MSDTSEVPSAGSVGSYYQNARTEIEPLLPPALGSVLEIGCATGATMAWLRSIRPVRYAAGIELFPAAAEIARSTFDSIEVSDIDSARCEFPADQFDTVLALDVLEHLSDPAATVNRLRDKIRPGGVFVASIPNVAHYSVALPLLFKGAWRYQDGGLLDRTHLHFFTRQTALSLFTDAGFEIAGLNIVRKVPDLLGLRSHPNRKVRWYAQRLLDACFRWPRHLFAYQFLIAARRR